MSLSYCQKITLFMQESSAMMSLIQCKCLLMLQQELLSFYQSSFEISVLTTVFYNLKIQ